MAYWIPAKCAMGKVLGTVCSVLNLVPSGAEVGVTVGMSVGGDSKFSTWSSVKLRGGGKSLINLPSFLSRRGSNYNMSKGNSYTQLNPRDNNYRSVRKLPANGKIYPR